MPPLVLFDMKLYPDDMSSQEINDICHLIDDLVALVERRTRKVSLSSFDTKDDLIAVLRKYKVTLQLNYLSPLMALGKLLAPTGDLQDLSIDNGWADSYLNLSLQFDEYVYGLTRCAIDGGIIWDIFIDL